MTELRDDRLERRLLIMAPVGKDAALIEGLARADGIDCTTCDDLDCLMRELRRGAAAVLVAEEALNNADGVLPAFLSRQPAWSDLPVLLLTRPGADSTFVERAAANVRQRYAARAPGARRGVVQRHSQRASRAGAAVPDAGLPS